MSKRRSFGRFTAMGLAGLTAVSSMAVVANAEAYPSSVYEFQYHGIGKTPMFNTAVTLANTNTYVKADVVADVFTNGFLVSDAAFADAFGSYTLADLGVSNTTDGDSWVYVSKDAISGALNAVVPEDYIKDRDELDEDPTEVVLYFKSKSERDNAKNAIANANASEFRRIYSSAATAIGKDLDAAVAKWYQLEVEATTEYGDVETAEAAYAAAKVAYDKAVIVYNNTPNSDESAKEAAKDARDLAKEAMDNAKDALDIAKGYLKAAEKLIQYDRDNVVKPKVKQIVNEFKSAYKDTNFDFDYTNKTDAADSVFDIDDSKPQVVLTTVAGGYVSGATYVSIFGTDITVDDAYYRTVGQYVSPESYAFTGEIISKDQRKVLATDLEKIKAYLLDSDRWSQFSVLSEGKDNDNDNTTEPGKGDNKEDNKNNTTPTTDQWLPGAGYQTVNESGISYQGKNGKWYTSSAAAELYGGGFSGNSRTSNYAAVKNNNTLYFSADDGNYYTSASSAGAHSYLVKNVAAAADTTQKTDPYYYYFMMGNTSSTIDPDAPTIYGNSKRSGWTKITSYIKASSTGSTVKIDMNATSTVPASVLAAAKDKGVNLLCVNENGSKVTIKAGSVSTAYSLNVAVTYNVKNVRSSLVKAAKKANPGTVSTAQIQVGNNGSLGGTVTTTVKMSAKRAGDTVKAYRLTDSGKLTREATGVVKADGTLSFNLKNGGSYLLVVIE